jgi:hypothetical protein
MMTRKIMVILTAMIDCNAECDGGGDYDEDTTIDMIMIMIIRIAMDASTNEKSDVHSSQQIKVHNDTEFESNTDQDMDLQYKIYLITWKGKKKQITCKCSWVLVVHLVSLK